MKSSLCAPFVRAGFVLLIVATATLTPGCGGGGGGGGDGLSASFEIDPVAPGGSTSAYLMVSKAEGIAGLDLDLAYDSSQVSVSYVSTTGLQTYDFTHAYGINASKAENTLSVCLARAEGLTGNVEEALLEIGLEASGSASPGSTIPLYVDLLEIYDETPISMSLKSVLDGQLQIYNTQELRNL